MTFNWEIFGAVRATWPAAEELGVAIPGPPQYARVMTRTGVPTHDTVPKDS